MPAASPTSPSSRLLAPALALGTLALYAQVARFPFIHLDDPRYLTENGVVQRGLSRDGLAWAFTTFHAGNWHPLTWLSHMLDVALFGMDPGAHHLVNASFHAAAAALLFLALARLTGAPGRSLAVAALFAVHPLHVESVAWVAERKDVLSTSLGMLALLAYARHAERPSAGRMAQVALAMAASLLAKPMWVTLPFLLLLLDAWPLRRLAAAAPAGGATQALGLARRVREKWPLFALSAASSAVTVLAQRRGGAMDALDVGLAARAGNALLAYARYLGKTFWPVDLALFYPHPAGDLSVPAVLGAALLIMAISAGAWRERTRRPWLAVGWCWFLGTLLPVIGLVQVGSQAMADRYSYLPSIGLFIAVAWGVAELAGAVAAWLPRTLALAGVVALSLLTWHQLGFWRDHETLLRHALVAGGESDFTRAVLSEGLRREGKLEAALAEAREAIRLAPASPKHWTNLGLALLASGRPEEARQALQRASALAPDFLPALTNLSSVALSLGDQAAAAEAALQATRVAPQDATGWHRLAQARAAARDFEGAIECAQRAVRLDPGYAAAWTSLAIALQSAGRIDEAGHAFATLPRLEPAGFVGWRNLGVHLAGRGQLEEAKQALFQASQLRPEDADVLDRLGQVQAAQGDRVGVSHTLGKLERLDPARATGLRSRLGARP